MLRCALGIIVNISYSNHHTNHPILWIYLNSIILISICSLKDLEFFKKDAYFVIYY